MNRSKTIGKGRRAALALAGIVGLAALVAFASGGGIVVDTGTGGGDAFNGTSDTGAGGRFEGLYGVVARGILHAGLFQDIDHGTQVVIAEGETGIGVTSNSLGISAIAHGGASAIGGWFSGDFAGIHAYGIGKGIYAQATSGVAGEFLGDPGLKAYGREYGGFFEDTNDSGEVTLAFGDIGLYSRGDDYGIYSSSSAHSSSVAGRFQGYTGIKAYGVDRGIFASASSNVGGEFHGDPGLMAYGREYGGYFEDTNDSGMVNLAIGDTGVQASGDVYGIDSSSSGNSGVGGRFMGFNGLHAFADNLGIWASGSGIGGRFDGDYGIKAFGDYVGVYAENTNTGAYVELPSSTKALLANGPVGTVQNHPYDAGLVVISTAPVGDEFATYTRGSATLKGGETVIPLSEAFTFTTNPDYGLTAHLTPVGDWADLYVAEKTTEHIVVRSRGPNPDAAFDFQVWGLRIGFEDSPVMRERTEDAGLPMMASHHKLYAGRPDLDTHNASSRFGAIEAKARGVEINELDVSHSEALKAAIGVRRPIAAHAARVDQVRMGESDRNARVQPSRNGRQQHREPSIRDALAGERRGRVDDAANPDVYARSFQPSLTDLARYLSVAGPAGPGDVLVASADGSGHMQRSNIESDPAVVGVVSSAPGLVLGSESGGQSDDIERRFPVVLMGIADVNVDAGYGPVGVGDLLTTSPTPGHAMRDVAALPGTVLGKALQPLDSGTGTIQVLITLQ